jgi:hypothetical protein
MVALMGIGTMTLPVITTVIAGFIIKNMIMHFWVSANANEWLLIIRSGQLKYAGIGACSWRLPGD